MRRSVVALAVVALALPALPGFAAAADSPMKVCSEQWQAMKKAGAAKGSYQDFSKACLSKASASAPAPAPGPKHAMMAKKPTANPAATPAAAAALAPAPSPAVPKAPKAPKAKGAPTVKASDTDPTGATAQCKDGTYSHSKSHSGSCAGHKGVAKFLS
jgi:hypothetical protein